MMDCHPASTPLEASEKLDKSMVSSTSEEQDEMKNTPYKEAVGCVLYLSRATRPDISYAVNVVSQFCHNPGKKHWTAVKRIFRYLKGITESRLCYRRDGNADIVGYTDADRGGDLDTRRSTTGYVFVLQSGAISWSVKKQPTFALSSCEAELMALAKTVQEALWWRNLLWMICGATELKVYCDNQSALCLAKNGAYNPWTIDVQYINTKHQAADGFTKPLTTKISDQKILIGILN
ncbi:uncharacterized protein LOC129753227 [Uranotaenia lowii]|uniref:uncharacterized protein LOC129753227 n=1 Tax=Uranotaenia lowii TaxID=190385 RepID=UPI00247985F4|nr:uncharacterized protein LOC129753227 [Uranotaenia lowii]